MSADIGRVGAVESITTKMKVMSYLCGKGF
jgi:hypothetical protein